MQRILRGIALVALVSLSLSCKKDKGLTYLSLTSVPGDSIGQGRQLNFTSATGDFEASRPDTRRVAVRFEGEDSTWNLEFAVPTNAVFRPGTFENATLYPAESPYRPGLSVSGDGRGCKRLTGHFVVREAVFGPGSSVERLAVDYEQRCDGDQGALIGSVRINSSIRPGQTAGRAEEAVAERPGDEAPVHEAPAEEAPVEEARVDRDRAGRARSLGTTYIDFDSTPGDYIGGGRHLSFTPDDGTFKATSTATNRVAVNFDGGDQWWTLEFAVPARAVFKPGTYVKATRYPFQSPTRPGLNVSGSGRGCNQLTGRFVVREVVLGEDTEVERLAVDFEQNCEGRTAAPLTGSVRINSSIPPGPIPDQLAGEAAERPRTLGTTFILFDSIPGDYIGGGRRYTLTPDDGNFSASHGATNLVSVNFDGGSDSWHLEFAAPAKEVLTQGTYERATRYPFQSPTRPGLSIGGSGRGCNTLTGHFVVREAVFGEGTEVERLAVDFEQSCEGGKGSPLLGSVRINSSIPAPPPRQ